MFESENTIYEKFRDQSSFLKELFSMSVLSSLKPQSKYSIKAIIFDVGSTIFYATPKIVVRQMHHNLTKSLAADLEWDDKDEQDFNKCIKHLYYEFEQRKKHVNTGSILDEMYVDEPSVEQQVRRAIPLMSKYEHKSEEELFGLLLYLSKKKRGLYLCILFLLTHQKQSQQKQKQGFKEVLEWLVNNKYRCAVCSNENEAKRLHDSLDKFGLKKYLDKVIISTEMKLRKPDYRVVEPILNDWKEKYDINANEVVFIGDKVETDILCAKHSGMRCLLSLFYDRTDAKWESQSKIDPEFFKLRGGGHYLIHNLYLYTIVVVNNKVLELIWEVINSSWPSFMDHWTIICHQKIQYNNGKICRKRIKKLEDREFFWRPIVIGILLHKKKFNNLKKAKCMELLQMPIPFRKDIILKQIDLSADCKVPLAEQGPFDIIVPKLMYWRVAQDHDEKSAIEIKKWDDYFQTLFTQFDLKDEFGKPLFPYSVRSDNRLSPSPPSSPRNGNTDEIFHNIMWKSLYYIKKKKHK
ncbi:hypothetical protein RFI_08599 [Reticulomyxa filosa]|uniref:Uncharacterized protein n=1 Tax=Reticulomyxa filosa TaxID=46433 RepID=X6NT97_RETFI|nr:hypothetical protein RFI_08599 [Reticulomyxa filosa]|eukprot:ETO28532.1 hypothetical protein RFI_08599 [Reticulomyxa filosa]